MRRSARLFSLLLLAGIAIFLLLLSDDVVVPVSAQKRAAFIRDATPAPLTVPTPAPNAGGAVETPAERQQRLRDRELGVSTAQWITVPLMLSGTFFLFLLSCRKFKIFGSDGKKVSFRVFMQPYVSLETTYHTLAGATEEFAAEQRKAELGHQFFQFVVTCILTGNTFFGTSLGVQPLPFAILMLSQLFLLWMSFIMDIFMIKVFEYLRIVRSVNTKLRLAIVSFQCLLFALDSISGAGLASLPVDCFQTALAELSRESVGMLGDGEVMVGFAEAILVVLVVQTTLTDNNKAAGSVAAFGISSLSLSCLAILGGMIFKIYDAVKEGPDNFIPDEEEDEEELEKEKKRLNKLAEKRLSVNSQFAMDPPSSSLSGTNTASAPSGKSQAKHVAPHPKATVSPPAKS